MKMSHSLHLLQRNADEIEVFHVLTIRIFFMAMVVELYLHEEKEVWNTSTLKQKSFQKRKRKKTKAGKNEKEEKTRRRVTGGDKEVREKQGGGIQPIHSK